VTIPDTIYGLPVTIIAWGAFNPCERLTGVTIPASVTNIGFEAFPADFNLTTVTIASGLTSIGEDAFEQDTNLTSVTIGNGVTTNGEYAFNMIGEYAFAYCSALTNVTIGRGVTRIGDYAFLDCSRLASVTIPCSVTSIGDFAFAGSGLTSVTIPASVTNIDSDAFSDCNRLSSIYFTGNAPALSSYGVFGSDIPQTVYYLPDTTGWSNTFGGLPAVLWNSAATGTQWQVDCETAQQADLTKSSDKLDDLSPLAGETVTASITITNQPCPGGAAAAGAFYVGFYWSANLSFGGVAPFYEAPVGGCPAGATVPLTQRVTIPPTTTQGTYYLGYKINDSNEVAECDESNNGIYYWTLTVLPPCPFTLNTTTATFGTGGGSGSVSVTASNGCAWTATSNNGFITITSGDSGSGNGTVDYSVAANTGTTGRAGTMTVAGQTFTVTQAAGGSSADLTKSSDQLNNLSPLPGEIVTASITITNQPCPGGGAAASAFHVGFYWSTTSSFSAVSPFDEASVSGCAAGASVSITQRITIASITTPGLYYLGYKVDDSNEVAECTVADKGIFYWTVTVLPSCPFTLSTTTATFVAAGGSGSVSVTASNGCAWTATSNDSFITITSGASGSGNGTVDYTVAANTSTNALTGSMTIAGQTFTVMQAASESAPVVYDILSSDTLNVAGLAHRSSVSSDTCTFLDGGTFDLYDGNYHYTGTYILVKNGRQMALTLDANGQSALESNLTDLIQGLAADAGVTLDNLLLSVQRVTISNAAMKNGQPNKATITASGKVSAVVDGTFKTKSFSYKCVKTNWTLISAAN
jgi:hypothetical protein